MPRPPDPEKRRELARRAVAVLQREGLEISMSRLAELLECKRPTLLYHFATRAEIVEVALEDLLRQQAAFVMQRVAEHAHPIDRLYAQLRGLHAFHHDRESRVVFLTQAIAASAGPRIGEIIAFGNAAFETHRRAAAERIRTGIAAGTVAPCDVDALMALVRAATDGLLIHRVMTGKDLTPVHEFLWSHVLRPLKRHLEESSD